MAPASATWPEPAVREKDETGDLGEPKLRPSAALITRQPLVSIFCLDKE